MRTRVQVQRVHARSLHPSYYKFHSYLSNKCLDCRHIRLLNCALFTQRNLQLKKLSDLRIKPLSARKVGVKKPARLNWQVDLRITKQLICTVSACKSSRHAGWRGMELHL